MDLETLLASDSDENNVEDIDIDLESLLMKDDEEDEDETSSFKPINKSEEIIKKTSIPSTSLSKPTPQINQSITNINQSKENSSTIKSPYSNLVSSTLLKSKIVPDSDDDDEENFEEADAVDVEALISENHMISPSKDTEVNKEYKLNSSSLSIELDNDEDEEEDEKIKAIEVHLPSFSNSIFSNIPKKSIILSCQSIQSAEKREHRTLSYGDKLPVSALQIKPDQLGRLQGLLNIEELSTTSSHLKRGVTYQLHGPGATTSYAVCENFIALGSQRGQIHLVEHSTQQIIGVLPCPPNLTKSSNYSVSCIDVFDNGNLLLATYRSLDIVLWDTAKKTILRQIHDNRNGDFFSLKTVPLISSRDKQAENCLAVAYSVGPPISPDDTVGYTTNISRIKITKNLLSSFSIDVDCLLDEMGGRVIAIESLPPLTSIQALQEVPRYFPMGDKLKAKNYLIPPIVGVANSTNSKMFPIIKQNKVSYSWEYDDISTYPLPLQFFAFSLPHSTCIVQLSPYVKVIHKWLIPGVSSEIKGAGNMIHTKEEFMVTHIDWSWLYITSDNRVLEQYNPSYSSVSTSKDFLSAKLSGPPTSVPDVEGVWTPALTRVRGQNIEILLMRSVFTEAGINLNSVTPETLASIDTKSPTPFSPVGPSTPGSVPQTPTGAPTSARRSSLMNFTSFSLLSNEPPSINFDFQVYSSTYIDPYQSANSLIGSGSDSSPYNNITGSPAPIGLSLNLGKIKAMKWASATRLIVYTPRFSILFDSELRVLVCKPLLPPLIQAMNINLTSPTKEEFGDDLNSDSYIGTLPQYSSINLPSTSGQGSNFSYDYFRVHPSFSNPSITLFRGHHFFLITTHIYRIVITSPFSQINKLMQHGKWLEALARVVECSTQSTDQFEGSPSQLKSENTEVIRPHFLIDEQQRVKQYILNYVSVALKRHPSSVYTSSNTLPLSVQQHFKLVASVCVEYCTYTHNLPVLFTDIYEIFKSEGGEGCLLEAIEPFICSNPLSTDKKKNQPHPVLLHLPPTIITRFLEHAMEKQQSDADNSKVHNHTLERCLSYLPLDSIDINRVTRFLYIQKLFSPFLFVFANGLNDFSGAFEIVFEFISTIPDHDDDDDDDEISKPSFLDFGWKRPLESSSSGDSIETSTADIKEKELLYNSKLCPHGQSNLKSFSFHSPPHPEIGYKLLLFILHTANDYMFPLPSPHSFSASNIWSLLNLILCTRYPYSLSSTLRQIYSPYLFLSDDSEDYKKQIDNRLEMLSCLHYPYLLYFTLLDIQALFHTIGACLVKLEKESIKLDEENIPSNSNFSTSSTSIQLPTSPSSHTTYHHKVSHVLSSLFNFSYLYDNHNKRIKALQILPLFFQTFQPMFKNITASSISFKLLMELIKFHSNQVNSREDRLKVDDEFYEIFSSQSKFYMNTKEGIDLRMELWNKGFFKASLAIKNCYFDCDTEVAINAYCKDSQSIFTQRSNLSPTPFTIPSTETFSTTIPSIELLEKLIKESKLPIFNYILEQHNFLQNETELARSTDAHNCWTQSLISFQHKLITNILTISSFSTSIVSLIILLLLLPYNTLRSSIYNETLFSKIIEASHGDAEIQFKILRGLIFYFNQLYPDSDIISEYFFLPNNKSPTNTQGISTQASLPSMPIYLSVPPASPQNHLLLLLKLIARFEPPLLKNFIKDHFNQLPFNAVLALSRENHVSDATAYLLFRIGDSAAALSVLLADFGLKVKNARKEIDLLLKQEASQESSVNMYLPKSISSKQFPNQNQLSSEKKISVTQYITKHSTIHMEELSQTVNSCTLLLSCLNSISELCEQHHHKMNIKDEKSSSNIAQNIQSSSTLPLNNNNYITFDKLWSTALDFLLKERSLLKSGNVSSSSEIISHYLSYLLHLFIIKMKQLASSSSILTQVLNHASVSNIKLGDLRSVLTLEEDEGDGMLNGTIKNNILSDILKKDLLLLMREKNKLRRGPVFKSNKSGQITPEDNVKIEDPASIYLIRTKQTTLPYDPHYFESKSIKELNIINEQKIADSLPISQASVHFHMYSQTSTTNEDELFSNTISMYPLHRVSVNLESASLDYY